MNIASFDKIALSEEWTLVYFYASWCGPCKAMSPILKKLQSDIGRHVRFIHIDIDKSGSVTERYRVKATPTFILLNKGKSIWRKTGGMPIHLLKKEISAFLSGL